MLNIKIHDRTITKKLKKYGLFGRVVRRRVVFSLKRALQYDEENVELLVIMHNIISGPTYQHKHIIPTVKHNDGGVMIWAYSAATGFWTLVVFESAMNSGHQRFHM